MAQEKHGSDDIWQLLKSGAPNNKDLLVLRGDPQKLEEARRLLESQQKLQGIEVAKW
jgi:hypothetical protein